MKKRRNVYILEHISKYKKNEDEKLLGVYSSRKNAMEAIERYFEYEGFNEHPKEEFEVFVYELNKIVDDIASILIFND